MKRHSIYMLIRLVMSGCSLLAVAGCPVDSTQLPAVDSVAGTYWVEYQDGQLSAYELPQYRGEPGTWRTLAVDRPDWYTGPALYEVNQNGSWLRLTVDDNLTLDDVMQLHDPPPRPPTNEASSDAGA